MTAIAEPLATRVVLPTFTNVRGLPQWFVNAVEANTFPRRGRNEKRFSVTDLCSPPLHVQLNRAYRDKIVEDVGDRIWALFGSAVHKVVEAANTKPGERFVEEYLSTVIDGVRVTGKTDVYEKAEEVWDLKVVSPWSRVFSGREAWGLQTNLYAQLWREVGFPPKSANVMALYKGWSKLDYLRRGDPYPKWDAQQEPIELLSASCATEMLVELTRRHERARTMPLVEIPVCTPEERWQTPTTYAVKWRKGGKECRNAVKHSVKNTKEEALVIAVELDGSAKAKKEKKEHFVEVRQAACKRCAKYCAAAPFCPFGKQWVEKSRKAEEANAGGVK